MSIELIQTYALDIRHDSVACRAGCGACCIAPSISSPIPDMPQGKPAGVRCVQLSDLNQCLIFGLASRPRVCLSLKPELVMCAYLVALESATSTH
jgi:Fe-S-cluster containining protein